MSELLALGTSHKTAPLALRERSRSPTRRPSGFLRELAATPAIREAVVVSTCNRTELYLVVTDPVEAESAVLGMLARRAGSARPSCSRASTRTATATPRGTCTGSRAGWSR